MTYGSATVSAHIMYENVDTLYTVAEHTRFLKKPYPITKNVISDKGYVHSLHK